MQVYILLTRYICVVVASNDNNDAAPPPPPERVVMMVVIFFGNLAWALVSFSELAEPFFHPKVVSAVCVLRCKIILLGSAQKGTREVVGGVPQHFWILPLKILT